MVKVLVGDSRGHEFNSQPSPTGNDLEQVIRTRAYVTKQYNLVLVVG